MRFQPGYALSLVLLTAPSVAGSYLNQEGSFAADSARIISEGKTDNQAYERLAELCEKFGPRVTGSPQLMAADEWAEGQMKQIGLKNVHLEQWGTVPVGFYRGTHNVGEVVAPFKAPIIFSTPNWTPGTKGVVTGPALLEPKTVNEVQSMGDKLKGAWILMPTKVGMRGPSIPKPTALDLALDDAGIAGRLYSTGGEYVWSHGNYVGLDVNDLPKRVLLSVASDAFNKMAEALGQGKPVTVKFDVDNHFTMKPQPVYDVVGDYPGTDLKDQIVVIGGHFDSWNSPGSQGASDNGTGAMIAMEAARLIVQTHAEHRRTLRVILYSGEEEGLLGSAGYVRLHKSDLEHFVAVLNDDTGSTAETGFTAIKGSEQMLAPLEPTIAAAFPTMPIKIDYSTRMPAGASDHTSWLAQGVPALDWGKAGGFGLYRVIWHTQNDNLAHVDKAGLLQSTVVSAVTLNLFLNSDQTLQRQPVGSPSD